MNRRSFVASIAAVIGSAPRELFASEEPTASNLENAAWLIETDVQMSFPMREARHLNEATSSVSRGILMVRFIYAKKTSMGRTTLGWHMRINGEQFGDFEHIAVPTQRNVALALQRLRKQAERYATRA